MQALVLGLAKESEHYALLTGTPCGEVSDIWLLVALQRKATGLAVLRRNIWYYLVPFIDMQYQMCYSGCLCGLGIPVGETSQRPPPEGQQRGRRDVDPTLCVEVPLCITEFRAAVRVFRARRLFWAGMTTVVLDEHCRRVAGRRYTVNEFRCEE